MPTQDNKKQKSFLKTFFANVPKEDIAMMGPENLAYTAQNHLRLSKKRTIGKGPIIDIFNPSLKKEGWDGNSTIIDIVNDDMAFLVDSVIAEIIRHNYHISAFVHPILHIETSKDGEIFENEKKGKTTAQSHIHIELNRAISPAERKELKENLERVLNDAYLANRDWQKMRDKISEAKDALKTSKKNTSAYMIGEYQEFLSYLYDNNFTFLGYREYKFNKTKEGLRSSIVKDSSLGVLTDETQYVYFNEARKSLTKAQQKLRFEQEPLTISKVNKNSTVHRRVPIDAITVKKYDSKGSIVGEILFIGLFTSVTYSRSVADIPYLRSKIDTVLRNSDCADASHNHKALKHILEKYPRDEILQMPEILLQEHANSILRLQERPQIALYTRTDPFGRYISCLVYVPRERYETRLRKKFQKILGDAVKGRCNTFKVIQDDSALSRVLFQVDINHLKHIPEFDNDELELQLIEAGQNWADQLKEVIEDKIMDDEKSSQLFQRYGNAFSAGYQEQYKPFQAVLDVENIDAIIYGDQIDIELYEEKTTSGELETHIKLYHAQTPLALSDVLPLMENMGLDIITELPSEVSPRDYDGVVWIHDFLVKASDSTQKIDVEAAKEPFENVFKRAWNKEMESDSLNMLSFYAQMEWRDITILRAYSHYFRQVGSAFSLPYIESAITTYPHIGAAIVSYFKQKFDPSKKEISTQTEKKTIKKIHDMMARVDSLDHDRILRSLVNFVRATLRTNFYQTMEDGSAKPYVSFKLNSNEIPELPEPKPYREIFVYSSRVEGVHLRGDQIARGGLRWSDRHEDFRTEVLGLMKAQQVKNAVIVPMGAKGGFVVKNPPKGGDRAAFMEEGINCYKTFIRGLLDITDNRASGKIIPPKDVARYDDNDPYLVVAADKGTASFSDIANGLSEEYGFWLGDAFASGGSAGYDHKKMGITARGAWESVKRHFREMGVDTQSEEFDVIGVGDMAGDVFGNGMLLSEHIRLIGAFNHMHIFCDPKPNAEKTFKERQRLFDDVKGWGDYNKKLLSKGGRIYSRSDKSLDLTPEIQKCFGIKEDKVSPNKLIRAMLRKDIDLLWFGGIGTYIKATTESDADVGDKGNDALRIDATEVKAKVLGEGANLGITQAARIECAQNGVQLNADYIDNAGGVASSDDEVNIKILFGDVLRKSKYKMDIKKRNKMLESMTDDVAGHVLRGTYQQAQGISLMAMHAPENLTSHATLIKYLKEKVGLSRTLEKLPKEKEIEERLRLGKGLTKPELSVLQSYAKISYTADLLDSDIPNSKAMEERLFRYFPPKLSKNYPKEILDHRLKREIIATTLANGIVHRMGPDFIRDRMEKCGASCEEVAKAYIIVREAFGLRDIWSAIEALDNKVDAKIQLEALAETARMMERAVTWFLTRFGRKLDINRDIAKFEDGIQIVKDNLNSVVSKSLLKKVNKYAEEGVKNGLPKKLAHDISLMPILGSAFDIIRISMDHKFEIPMTASVYFELGEHFHLDWMRQKARKMPAEGQWSSQALEGLIDQLYTCQAGLTVRILKDMSELINKSTSKKSKKTISSDSVLDAWIDDRGAQAKLIEPLFNEMRRGSTIDISMLIIAEQRLRNLYGG